LPPRVKKKKRIAAAEGNLLAEEKQPAETAAQAERERGAAALLRRAARAAKAAATAERPEHWLDAWTNMGVAIYGKNDELLVARCEQELSEEDPAAVADGAAAKPMLQPKTNT
jgi:methylase of polypeptide subunit release factors